MRKVLYVTRILPDTIMVGDILALFNQVKATKALDYEVDLLTFVKTKENILNIDNVKEKFGFKNIFYTNIEPKINFRCIFDWIFKSIPYIFNRFYSKQFSSKLLELVKTENYSSIIFEHSYMFVNTYFNKNIIKEAENRNIKLIINSHVSEPIVLERLCNNTKDKSSFVTKLCQKREISLLYKTEKDFINIAYKYILHGIEDVEKIKNIFPEYKNKIQLLEIIPFIDNYPYSQPELELDNSIYFLGGYSWFPNLDGVKYFINDIFPLILQKNPNTKFYIVGVNAPTEIKQLHDGKNIFFVGKVDDIFKEIQKYSVLVAPLRIGGGTRLKLLESIAWGKAAITTTIGAEGIKLHGENPIIIEDDPIIFAEKVLELLQNKNKHIEIKQNTRKFAEKHYRFEKFKANLADIFDEKF